MKRSKQQDNMTVTTKKTVKKETASPPIKAKTVKKNAKTTEKISKKTELAGQTAFSHELISISALARLFNIDRQTIRTRIESAGIQPVKVAVNEKLYELNEKLEAVLLQDELEAAKLEKLKAEGEIKKHELAIKKGEFGSVAEFTEITQKIFGKLFKKLAIQLPSRIANKVHNANSSAEVTQILKQEINNEFDSLRNDFTKYL